VTIKINGHEKRIGLALSGGGFRAAGFHLGVMSELHRLGILPSLDLVSCVSGGSIAGGTLVANWSNPVEGLGKLEEYLKTRSIAVASVIGGVFDPFESRLDKLAASYDRDLFSGITLAALKNGPRVYFNATNLATGNLFFFVAGGGREEELGEHELGTGKASNFLVSRAVAASSAFPPVFPPLRLDSDVYQPGAAVEYITLADGGVYDNMAVNPLLRMARNALDYMIISDGGKPFSIEDRPTESRAIVLKVGLDIMMEQIRGLEFDRIQHRHLAGKGPKPLWFSIDSKIGEKQPGDASFASSIGTNLKKLSEEEMTVLTRHGAALVAARIDQYAPELKTTAS
jgi:NTE family protein